MTSVAEVTAGVNNEISVGGFGSAGIGCGEDLGAAVDQASVLLGGMAASFAPECLSGSTSLALYSSLVGLERSVAVIKSLVARRIDESGSWVDHGFAHPAGLLAHLDGVGEGQARGVLRQSQKLSSQPVLEHALRRGEVSSAQANQILAVVDDAPEAEADLIEAVRQGCSFAQLRIDALRARNSGSNHDPVKDQQQIHHSRYLRFGNAADGSVRISGHTTADQGDLLSTILQTEADRLFTQAYEESKTATGTEGQDNPASQTPPGAFLHDALVSLVTQPSADGDGLRSTTTNLVLYCDLEALFRGEVLPGELCELATPHGPLPIPVPMARDLANDALLKLVFHHGDDIRKVCHLTRTLPATLKTALEARDRCCVAPGCTSTWNLEVDHIIPFAEGGPTTLDNVCLLCRIHHRMKTYQGYRLFYDEHGWHFDPPPKFEDGPEPPPPQWNGVDEATHIAMSRKRRRRARGDPAT